TIAEALINGLCPDPSSLLANPDFADRFRLRRAELVDVFERFRPDERAYSPLALFFNFSHNVVKGLVVDAVLRARPWAVALNDLLTSLPPDRLRQGYGESARALRAKAEGGSHDAAVASDFSRKKMDAAMTLMGYARRRPDRIRGRLTPVIVYDSATGRQAFGTTMRRLRAVLTAETGWPIYS